MNLPALGFVLSGCSDLHRQWRGKRLYDPAASCGGQDPPSDLTTHNVVLQLVNHKIFFGDLRFDQIPDGDHPDQFLVI